MNTRKQLLVLLCLLLGIAQMPEVNAQADPITAITTRLVPMVVPTAAALAASAIPLAARTAAMGTQAAILGTSAVILGVRAVPMIPAYVKERVSIRVPRPHFRKARNQEAPAADFTNLVSTYEESPEAYTVKTNVSGSVIKSEETLDGDTTDINSTFRTMLDGIEATRDSEAERAQLNPSPDVPVAKHRENIAEDSN